MTITRINHDDGTYDMIDDQFPTQKGTKIDHGDGTYDIVVDNLDQNIDKSQNVSNAQTCNPTKENKELTHKPIISEADFKLKKYIVQKYSPIYCTPCPDIMFTEKCNLRCKYCFETKCARNMENEKIVDYVKKQTNLSFFPFGGEPMLTMDTIATLSNEIQLFDINSDRKKELSRGMNHIITNGTLIKHNLDKLKGNQFDLQISIDGPKAIHDSNRVFADGVSGSFEAVMEGILLAQENNIPWSMHGVVNKKSISQVFEITKFYYETVMKYKGWDQTVSNLSGNCFQVIFEEDYDDKDIDDIISQLNKFCEWIWNKTELDIEQKKVLIKGYLTRKGGICSLGTSLIALDVDFKVYPCHRLASVPHKHEFALGDIYEPEHFHNYEMYNSCYRQARRMRGMYSTLITNKNFQNNNIKWMMWCPATNLETSGSLYYQNPKYNLMHYEMNRWINSKAFPKYHLESVNTNPQPNKCD